MPAPTQLQTSTQLVAECLLCNARALLHHSQGSVGRPHTAAGKPHCITWARTLGCSAARTRTPIDNPAGMLSALARQLQPPHHKALWPYSAPEKRQFSWPAHTLGLAERPRASSVHCESSADLSELAHPHPNVGNEPSPGRYPTEQYGYLIELLVDGGGSTQPLSAK